MNQKSRHFQIFGSEDSKDVDIAFFIYTMPKSIDEKKVLANKLADSINILFPNQTINPNLVVFNEIGCISEVYKGTVDELNNAMYYTYSNHTQYFPNKITKILQRDINLKFLRSSRMLLSYVTKTQYRNMVKLALKENIFSQINALEEIKLSEININKKINNLLDIYKSIAFQVGQSIALDNNVELYTKKAISDYSIKLNQYLYRKETDDLIDLEIVFNDYIQILKKRAQNMTQLVEYKYEEVNQIPYK